MPVSLVYHFILSLFQMSMTIIVLLLQQVWTGKFKNILIFLPAICNMVGIFYISILLIFLRIFFSSWHMRILVTPNISPICCRVIGPSLAATIVQFINSLFSIKYLHVLFSHGFCKILHFSKHFIFYRFPNICDDSLIYTSNHLCTSTRSL